jgi:hypothetical protein
MARSTEQLRARFCALRKSGRSILPNPPGRWERKDTGSVLLPGAGRRNQ